MSSQESGTSESSQPTKSTPKDALVMASILKEMGVTEYEPRVINQMIEFAYRKVSFANLLYIMFVAFIHSVNISNVVEYKGCNFTNRGIINNETENKNLFASQFSVHSIA